MPINVSKFRVIFLLGLVLSLPGPASSQLYHSFSLRASQIGFASNTLAGFYLTPRYTIGCRNLQAEIAAELPLKALINGDKWAGLKLRGGESVEVNRYLGKIRLKSQPQAGSLGIIYAAANVYRLDIRYKNEPVFGDIGHNTTLIIATYGAGFFTFFELNASPFNLLGAESLILTDFETIEAVLEVKTLVMRNLKLGIVLEALQPKPSFTDLYFSAYMEYAFRW